MSAKKTFLRHAEEFEKVVNSANDNFTAHWNTDYYRAFMQADAKFRAASEYFDFEYPADIPSGSIQYAMNEIWKRWETILPIDAEFEYSKTFIDACAEYENEHDELSEVIRLEGDSKAKIDEYIGKLREEVRTADWPDDMHRQRILNAINSLQTEIDRDISNYHLMLGKLEDLAEMFGRMGKKAKPAFDRAEQIIKAIKGERAEKLQIEKSEAPRQIEDKRDEEH